MIQNGCKVTFPDRRDYAHPSYGSTLPSSLPDYNCDPKITTPDQNQTNIQFSPAVPPLPFGCTSYTTVDLCIDEDLQLYSPMIIENVTHSSANGGGDIRTALEAARKVLNRGAYFNIQKSGAIDSFDAIRLAMYSTQDEKRAVSMGTPWYEIWSQTAYGSEVVKNADGTYTTRIGTGKSDGILLMPDISQKPASWHNYAVCGWKTISGVPMLIVKPWMGKNVGVGGFLFMPREVCNVVMSIAGSATFTLGKKPTDVRTIDLSFIGALVAYVRLLFRV